MSGNDENVHAVGRLTEVDRGYEAQKAAEAHLTAIFEADEAYEEAYQADGNPEQLPDSPAVGPWDGCETCTVREVLYAGWPYAEQVVLDAMQDMIDKAQFKGGTVTVVQAVLAELERRGIGLNGRSSASPETPGRLESRPRPLSAIDGGHGHENDGE